MTDTISSSASKPGQATASTTNRRGVTMWTVSLTAIALVAGGLFVGPYFFVEPTEAAVAPTPPTVAVSAPVQREVNKRLTLLGQFSAAHQVELRAQVGGTLTKIAFKDGDVVRKGDLLFQIDPTPYENRFIKATAAHESARTRLELANIEAARATALQKNGGGTAQNADQKIAEQRAAQAAVDAAKADIRDAQFDLDRTRIIAPFTGRIGTHQVSEGNLIAGSRAAASPTTLLATIVSTDTLYLNFDMSEADYLAFQRERLKRDNTFDGKVKIALADEKDFSHAGTLDFIDNTLDPSSGTIHARATVLNADGLLTPGGFARVQVPVAPASPALLVPDASVLPDQSEHVVLTVSKDNIVTPKQVQIGDLRNGLRVIRSGLEPSDRVIVSGIPVARAGAAVTPQDQQILTATN